MTAEEKYQALLGRVRSMFPLHVNILTKDIEWREDPLPSAGGELWSVTKDGAKLVNNN